MFVYYKYYCYICIVKVITIRNKNYMENFTYTKGLQKLGCTYLGGVKHSAKMMYSYNKGTLTYCLYLAPSTMAYGNKTTCPNDKYCKDLCLNSAGRNKGDILHNGIENSKINISRIKKTKLFYEDRETFMQLLVHEIKVAQNKAKKMNLEFSIRLNGTSDLSLLTFKLGGKNILEIFNDVQFYDYSKVFSRFKNFYHSKYKNYDITFSYNGYNWNECEEVLKMGGKVAIVFESNVIPKTFNGYNIENGNEDDMRYLNSSSSIIYLHYHRTANDYVIDEKTNKRKYIAPNTPFIIKKDDKRCEY